MMRILRRTTVFLAALLLTVAAGKAQTPLGQPSFDEQKVQVWCATAKFVYEDNGRPNLKSTLRCGGTLKEFENSIKADSQRVFSALYQPLEGRGAIYKGLGSNPSRLQKLKTEIISRLKSSPARRASPARMQRLASLETALTNYVENGTPIGNQTEEASTESADTTLVADDAAEAGDAGLDEAGVARPTEAARGAGESLINKFFGPLALIMALLSLVLYVLMRRNMTVFQQELVTRMTQRQDEIMASRSIPVAAAPAMAQQLSPELQRQVEQLVLQRVEVELAKREQTVAAVPAAAPEVPVAEVPRVAPQPVAVVAPVPSALSSAPETPNLSATQDTPVPMTEVAGPPVVIPVGSPATALREDFESIVPPVQLSEPAPAAPTEPAETIIRYAKAPFDGVFRDEDFTDELQDDSVYEVFLDPQWPELASFQVSPVPAVQTYLLQSAPPDLLAAACDYEQPTGPVAQVLTLEEGILRRVESTWQIEQKAVVQFEG